MRMVPCYRLDQFRALDGRSDSEWTQVEYATWDFQEKLHRSNVWDEDGKKMSEEGEKGKDEL